MTGKTETHTPLELFDAVSDLFSGAVVLAPILPGFLLCIPGIILFASPLALLVVVAAVFMLAGTVVAMPYLLVRFLVRRWHGVIVARYRSEVEPLAASLPRSADGPVEYVFGP
jgi:hypothetical protein